jgi:hypothetical protein
MEKVMKDIVSERLGANVDEAYFEFLVNGCNPMSQVKIAEKLGVTHQAVSNIMKAIFRKLERIHGLEPVSPTTRSMVMKHSDGMRVNGF